ncbi:MAG: alpha/beta fold hydrolase [Bacteroidota bacterium]
MRSEKINFENKSGEHLSGVLDMPISGKPAAYAIFAHCFTCSKTLTAVVNISRALTQHNIAVLRFDFTGLGESEGDFADTNFSTNINDLTEAYEYLEEHYEAPKILIGHSLGGAAVLYTAGQLEKVKAVATIGAPADPPHVKALLKEKIEDIKASGEATVDIGGRPFKIKNQFLEDIDQFDSNEVISNLGKALLVLHSPQDNIVGIENAAKIYTAAKHPKSYITLDGADHLLLRKSDSNYVGLMIANWATRYVNLDQYQETIDDEEVLTRTGAQGYTTEVAIGKHRMIADEPASVGGSNLGPTPYGYLSASLGACTSMTLRMYADQKKWPLEEVEVRLRHEKKHLEDCDEKSTSKVDHITRELSLTGDLSEEQRNRLLEIADRCPVHRTLHGKIVVETVLT